MPRSYHKATGDKLRMERLRRLPTCLLGYARPSSVALREAIDHGHGYGLHRVEGLNFLNPTLVDLSHYASTSKCTCSSLFFRSWGFPASVLISTNNHCHPQRPEVQITKQNITLMPTIEILAYTVVPTHTFNVISTLMHRERQYLKSGQRAYKFSAMTHCNSQPP